VLSRYPPTPTRWSLEAAPTINTCEQRGSSQRPRYLGSAGEQVAWWRLARIR
jgi:hypothetical protein